MIEAVTPADGTIATLGDLYGPPSDILGVLWAYSETSVSQVSQDITGLPIKLKRSMDLSLSLSETGDA